MRIVAIDSGTTNTKAWVVSDGEIVSEARGRAGARDVAGAQHRDWLAGRIREIAEEALHAAGCGWPDLEAMVGFGMLTSELGLEEVPHLRAPVGADGLAHGMPRRSLADDIEAPLFLVPGVVCDRPDLTGKDFMRGEETEVVGLLSRELYPPPFLYVSPGSHTKFVAVGEDGRIEWSFTTLSGELVWALSRETILAPLLDPAQPMVDPEAADLGAEVARETGLSRALYSARLFNRLHKLADPSCTDFIRGAIAAADVDGLDSLPDRPTMVVVGIAGPLGPFYRRILEAQPLTTRVEEIDEPLGPLGAWEVYGRRSRRPEVVW